MGAAQIVDGSPVATLAGGRDRILEAAAVRFAAVGFTATSLRAIAADADMKAGSLYYHFGSKDDLIIGVLLRGMTVMIDGFERVSAEPAIDQRNRLARFIQTHLESLHGNFEYTSLHVTSFRSVSGKVRAAILPMRDAYEESWNTLLAELLPHRSAHEIGVLRLVLFGAMNSSIEWFDAGRGNLAEFATIVTHQFWNGTSSAHEKDSL